MKCSDLVISDDLRSGSYRINFPMEKVGHDCKITSPPALTRAVEPIQADEWAWHQSFLFLGLTISVVWLIERLILGRPRK